MGKKSDRDDEARLAALTQRVLATPPKPKKAEKPPKKLSDKQRRTKETDQ